MTPVEFSKRLDALLTEAIAELHPEFNDYPEDVFAPVQAAASRLGITPATAFLLEIDKSLGRLIRLNRQPAIRPSATNDAIRTVISHLLALRIYLDEQRGVAASVRAEPESLSWDDES